MICGSAAVILAVHVDITTLWRRGLYYSYEYGRNACGVAHVSKKRPKYLIKYDLQNLVGDCQNLSKF